MELGETLRGTVDVRSCAAPVLERLVEKYGETTHLAVMDRWNVLYVDKILGNHNITVQGARVGTRLDAHSTAVGKVLLAQLEEIEVRRYLAMRPLRRLTPSTTTNPQALLDALAGVRSAGFAADLGETVSEVHCVAAPVRDDLGSVVAAVSVSVPATRFAQRRPQLERAVVGAAHEITRAIAEAHDCSPVPLRDDPSAAALVEASPRAS